MSTEKQYVYYRDIEMVSEWPERIRKAQSIPKYRVGKELVDRVRFMPDEERACGDCAVFRGEFHVPGCDMEVCPVCRGQIISCSCTIDRPEGGA